MLSFVYRARLAGEAVFRAATKGIRREKGRMQSVEIYSDDHFADVLDNWGEGTVWPEIQMLMRGRSGKVLDLACGTGRTRSFVCQEEGLEWYGCDISDVLLARARARGISPERLERMDATKMSYEDESFDFLYSIGSLEHFTEDGIRRTIGECRRVCKGPSFHMVPVSRSGLDEGGMKLAQSGWNNSVNWWSAMFEAEYGSNVVSMTSRWSDRVSVGRWFVAW